MMNENMKTALRALQDGAPADGRSVAALKRRDWADEEGKITHDGWEAYLDAVPTSKMTLIVLGTALHKVYAGPGRQASFPKGTRMTVVFAGSNKKGQRWYDCFASAEFGIVRVYQNRDHKIQTVRVPSEDLEDATISA